MAGNPFVPQGTLNRLRGSVIWDDFPSLNVVASFLGKEGIGFAPEGNITDFIDTMTGAVNSPAPYVPVRLSLGLLKTQNLSDLYKRQMEANSVLGSGTVRPDTTTLSPFLIINAGIEGVDELRFNGEVAGFGVRIKAYWVVNNDLWNI